MVTSQTLSGLHHLYSLSLSRNSLSSLPPDWLQNSPGLVRLNLSYNKISALPSHSFSQCPQLASLDLSHNKITSLAPAAGWNININVTAPFCLQAFLG